MSMTPLTSEQIFNICLSERGFCEFKYYFCILECKEFIQAKYK